jgi:3-oxoacyl-[acyl-carrier protein] reductase
MARVEGRIAVVTGGGQGIGAEVARRLAQGGATIAVLDLDDAAAMFVADEIGSIGGTAVAVPVDVANRASVESAARAVVDEFGSLRILVNNAGIIRDNMLFKMTDDDWTAVMDVHQRGAFLCTQAAQKHMVQARLGRIISMSSVAALCNRGQASYSAGQGRAAGVHSRRRRTLECRDGSGEDGGAAALRGLRHRGHCHQGRQGAPCVLRQASRNA